MTPQEEIQNLSTLLAETVQKISALEAKYKNPSGLPIISKPKVSKDKKQTKISLSKVFSLNETEISEVKKMAGIILDNYRILCDTTISRVKPTLVNNWVDMLKKEYSKYFGENNWAYYEAIKQVMQDRSSYERRKKKKQKVQEKMPNENIANQNNSDVEEIT
ncbi:32440_t:CDS:2, partial [Gigaspora margarita]